jgi:hypothetical protein
LTQHDFYHFGPTIRTQENTFITDQAVGPNTVDIKLMLGRFDPPDEIQGPDSLCVGGEVLFSAEKLVTSPQFELPKSACNTRVSTGPTVEGSWEAKQAVLFLPREVIGEIYFGLKIVR